MTIEVGTKGVVAYGGNGLDVVFPSGIAAGQLLVMSIGVRPINAQVAFDPGSGWMVQDDKYGTFGVDGVDAGPVRSIIATKIADGTEAGTTKVYTTGGANSIWGQISSYNSSTGEFYLDTALGEDVSSGTAYSASATPMGRVGSSWIRPGDVVHVVSALPMDGLTWSAESLSADGLVFSAADEHREASSATGNGLGGVVWHSTVVSGVQTNAPVVVSSTLSGAGYGPTTVLRISDSLVLDPEFPTVVARGISLGRGVTDVELPIPPGAKPGDLLVYAVLVSNSAAWFTDVGAKGWMYLDGAAVNTRQYSLLAKVYDPADKANYRLTLATAATPRSVMLAIRGHGVAAIGDIVRGTPNRRPSSTSLSTAPSITTLEDDALALALVWDASNALGLPVISSGAFVMEKSNFETGVASVGIEQPSFYVKKMPSPGATGDLVVDYTATAGNGAGVQVGIPRGDVPDPPEITIGQVVRYSQRVRQTKAVIGARKLSGGVVECVLFDASDAEVQRQTVTFNSTTSWGNATFTGLTPGSSYSVGYEVDGVVQTDAVSTFRTLHPKGVARSFSFGAGSCQFTASNFILFERMMEQNFDFFDHAGDLHYVDAITESAWRAGIDASMAAARFNQLMGTTPMFHSIDNHDRIITNPTGAGTGLNLGETDPQTAAHLKHLYGSSDWATEDTLGQAWSIGRVDFIHLDLWSVRDDADGDPSPRTFLGAAQKQWFKDTLEACEGAVIFWFSQWTNRNNANGRWNSFPEETSELEAWLNARPEIKRRMIMIGADSHSLQAGDGNYGGESGYRYAGIPNLCISGFNRAGDNGDGSAGWNIANKALKLVGQLESNYGGYSKVQIDDDGTHLRVRWEGIRVIADGTTNLEAYFERSYGQPWDQVRVGSAIADELRLGADLIWAKDLKGTP